MEQLVQQFLESDLSVFIGLGILFLFFCIQLYYYTYYYSASIRHNKKVNKAGIEYTNKLPGISVVISAQDDGYYLENILPNILKQDYPKYEVIVVNDGSCDDTVDILNKMQQEHKNLKTSFLPRDAKFKSRRKICIAIAIKSAENDIIVLTSSDCKPKDDQWLKSIGQNYTTGNELVLGASRRENTEGRLGNLSDFDNLFTTMEYTGYALCKKTFRGTINNMAFSRKAYNDVKGYSRHLNLESGEEDLFVQDVAKECEVKIEERPSAILVRDKEITSKVFRMEHEQRMENRKLYPFNIRFNIALELCSRYLFWGMAIAMMLTTGINMEWIALTIAAVLFLSREITQAVVVSKNAKLLGCKAHLLGMPVYEMILPLYELYLSTIGRIGRKRHEIN